MGNISLAFVKGRNLVRPKVTKEKHYAKDKNNMVLKPMHIVSKKLQIHINELKKC